jgi:hypothetical protein
LKKPNVAKKIDCWLSKDSLDYGKKIRRSSVTTHTISNNSFKLLGKQESLNEPEMKTEMLKLDDQD